MKRKKGPNVNQNQPYAKETDFFFLLVYTRGCPGIISCTATSFTTTSLVGLSDFYTSCGPQRFLDVAIDGELTSSESSDHEETGTDTRVGSADTELLGDLDQTRGRSLSGQTLALIDLGQHGVGGLGDDGGGETGDETRGQVVDGLHAVGGLGLVDDLVDGLVDLLDDNDPLQSSKVPFEYLLLPPRSALEAVRPGVTPKPSSRASTPADSPSHKTWLGGGVWVTRWSAIHFQG